MRIRSSAFDDNQKIPSVYTCDGDNMNPSLQISEVPENAQSLVLIVDDPDAPGKTFTHWLMWNIPPQTKEILESDCPEGAEQGLNDRGQLGYQGPCPPSGVHHYHFKLYALNRKLDVTSNITKNELEKEIDGCLIEKAELVGIYSRSS